MTRGPLSSPSGAGWSGGTGYVGEGEKDRAKGRAWGVAARRVRPSVKSGVVADRGVAPFTALAQSELLGRRARPSATTLGMLRLRIDRADGAQGGGTNGVLVGINLMVNSEQEQPLPHTRCQSLLPRLKAIRPDGSFMSFAPLSLRQCIRRSGML